MGYASYETPLGEAGYAVEDVCNQEGCEVAIDRGLSYLCGDQPGRDSEHGCGRWFCGSHLRMPEDLLGDIMGSGLCPACFAEHDSDDNRAERIVQALRIVRSPQVAPTLSWAMRVLADEAERRL